MNRGCIDRWASNASGVSDESLALWRRGSRMIECGVDDDKLAVVL